MISQFVSRSGLVCMMLLALCMVGCKRAQVGEATVSPAPAPNPLKVGVARTLPPIIFKDDQGNTLGIEADLARELADELGRPLELHPIYFPDLIFELRSGRIDLIMSGMSTTQYRTKLVDFTEPYLVVGQKALTLDKHRGRFPDNQAILDARMRVGVEESGTGEMFANRRLSNADIIAYPTFQEALTALIDERIDLVMHDSAAVAWAVRERPDANLYAVPGRFTTETLAWAVAQDNTELRTRINDVLAQWKQSGHLREVVSRWIDLSE